MLKLLAILASLACLVQADPFAVDVFADVPDSAVADISEPVTSAFSSPNPPSVAGYVESSFPAPPPAPIVGLVRPPFLFAGLVRTFSEHYNHVVVFGGCIRVTVIVDATESVTISGPVASNLNKIFTWVVNGVLYVRPDSLSIAEVSQIVVVVRIRASANVISVTAHSQGIVTLVDATNPIAQQYQLFLYLYYSSQILKVQAVVYKINTFAYGTSHLFIVGRCIRHFLKETNNGWVDARGLYTRVTDLSLWDASVSYVRASHAINALPMPLKIGQSAVLNYCVPPTPILNLPPQSAYIVYTVATC